MKRTFRKGTMVVEAIQYTGHNLACLEGVHKVPLHSYRTADKSFEVGSMMGNARVYPGDYLVVWPGAGFVRYHGPTFDQAFTEF